VAWFRFKLADLNFLSFENRSARSQPVLQFALFVAMHLVLVYLFVRTFFRLTWDQHVASGPVAIILTGLVCSLVMCFGEYFFHRYLLHIDTVRFLGRLCASHRAHHKVTAIRFDDEKGEVRSDYPIEDVTRDHHATFPPWALLPFFAAFTPFFASIAFSFPGIPILISGYAAIAIAHFLYEVLHVIHHQPYESWWAPRLRGRFSPFWHRLYGFHQAHHANYKCNINVAGFFGVPVADMVFGTYRRQRHLLIDGARATKGSARDLTPSPRWPIAWLDRVAFKRRRWMVKRS
jgi:hemolysin III